MELYKSSEIAPIAECLLEKMQTNFRHLIRYRVFEHVGSKAIVGAITKGDIDYYMEVVPSAHFSAVRTLQDHGFSIAKDTHRSEELCMLKNNECAIQVVASGSKYEFFREFRDVLNRNPDLVSEYNEIKRNSACFDVSKYREKKSAFIEAVLESP